MASSAINDILAPETKAYWEWQTSLDKVPHASNATDSEILSRLNSYVSDCASSGERPLLTGMALAAGFNGPSEMRRAALRRPSLLPIISRALTLVASGYEGMIGHGNAAGPIFMLKNIPDFDSITPREPGVYTFKDTVQVDTRVQGHISHEHSGEALSPREAYLKVIKGVTIENAEYAVLEEETPDTLPGRIAVILDNAD